MSETSLETPVEASAETLSWYAKTKRQLLLRYAVEWAIIVFVALMYSRSGLLDFDAAQLQQTGEHNESATLPLLAEIGLSRYNEIPLWNPYMLTGFPHAGDLVNHFWHPISTLPIMAFGGINGMKVSIFLALVIAGLGQWWFGQVFGLRGFVRLWSGLLFMISGGLALLWALGWYELLLGMAWFPWCFGMFWWALRRRDGASLALTTICIAMVLTTGGGYYPFYLAVSLAVLFVVAMLFSRPEARKRKLARAAIIGFLSLGVVAVMVLPIVDGYRYTLRLAGIDLEQKFSQPIAYALINYLISDDAWIRAGQLGAASGSTWFYIGYVPLLALIFVPLAFVRSPRRRPLIIAAAALTLTLLAWHANRSSPVKYLYDWIPFLYTFRFPNRLLILAASPLIVTAGFGLQYLFSVIKQLGKNYTIAFQDNDAGRGRKISLGWVLGILFGFFLILTLRDVYQTNKGFAFAPRPLNQNSYNTLSWIRNQDSDLYYTSAGGGSIYWDWTPAAYSMEMPIINFNYNRQLASYDEQRDENAPFFATPRYIIQQPADPAPENGEKLRHFDGVDVWYVPDAMPFAFAVEPERLRTGEKVTSTDVEALEVRLNGPNRVVVTAESDGTGKQLVVLVSDYPGWRVYVDGRPAPMKTANDYLGTTLISGEHTYEFVFRPIQHYIGLGITLISLVIVLLLIVSTLRRPSSFEWWAAMTQRLAQLYPRDTSES